MTTAEVATASRADLEARLAELDDHASKFGLSPDGKAKRREVEELLTQVHVEETSARAQAEADLEARGRAFEEEFASFKKQVSAFVEASESYLQARVAYDAAAARARKAGLSFTPLPRWSIIRAGNSDEARELRHLQESFDRAASSGQW